MSSKFDDFLQEQLQDSEILKEFETLQAEHTVIQAEIDAGQKSEFHQRALLLITDILVSILVGFTQPVRS